MLVVMMLWFLDDPFDGQCALRKYGISVAIVVPAANRGSCRGEFCDVRSGLQLGNGALVQNVDCTPASFSSNPLVLSTVGTTASQYGTLLLVSTDSQYIQFLSRTVRTVYRTVHHLLVVGGLLFARAFAEGFENVLDADFYALKLSRLMNGG
jgi:hypothetical protein